MTRSTIDSLKRLTEVGIALSSEKDNQRLMEMIIQRARELTGADGGTLYTRGQRDELVFEIMFNGSLGIALGGTSGNPIELPAVPLYHPSGMPNHRMVAARAAVTGRTVNIPDAYDDKEFDFSGTRDFDERTGYRSTSFLTVPMRNHQDEVIGVLQLINAQSEDGRVLPFDREDQLLVESLASQAAIALTNKRLIDEQRELFESFIELIAAAIDDKSPYTGGHCRRVPELTMMLAQAAAEVDDGPLRSFSMNDDDRYELKIAGWLHDCGKVATPEYVVDKATKLETIFDRLEMVRTRFEAAKLGSEVEFLRDELDRSRGGGVDSQAQREARERRQRDRVAQLEAEYEFLARANRGGEFMPTEDQERIMELGRRHWKNQRGDSVPLLTENEIYNLVVPKGTLNAEERQVINNHIVTTIKMLESLPYPKHLQRVPEFAGGHHEHMDGTGYPRGLRRHEMSVQARAMGIADIFEALTAGDRPYKRAMPLSQALRILGQMSLDDHIDPDLFDVFIRQKVYLKYAEEFLEPSQIDDINLSEIPGYQSDRTQLAS